MSFTIQVNNSPLEVHQGETLLNALRRNGIKIPTLCHMSGFTPSGACRLCVVEIEGKKDLITSCSYPVEEGMAVKTNSLRVISARKSLVEMLLSNHPDDCLYCERNGNCELQWLAEEMNITERKYFSQKNSHKRDHSSTSVYRDPAKCILCNRCVRVCEEVQLVTAIEFIYRGNKTTVNSAFNKGLNVSSCINCGQCIMVCPTGALVDIPHTEKVQSAITGKKKFPVAMISPAFVSAVAEHLGLKPADNPWGLIVAALKKAGFKKVIDMGWASDLNIRLEAQHLLKRLEDKAPEPMLSSCCPAWIQYAEEFVPHMIPDIATAKSPQQLMGRMLKNEDYGLQDVAPENIFTVSFSVCTANKFEASREENTRKGISEVDAIITVREFLKLMRSYGLDIRRIEPDSFDKPFSESSTASLQTVYSGGKAEAVAQQLNHLLNGNKSAMLKFTPPKNPGGRKEVKVKIGKHEVGFAWVSGIADVQKYFDDLKAEKRTDIHYVEVMACSGGCAGGGGQPIHWQPDKFRQRKKMAQEMEKSREARVAFENIQMETFINRHIVSEEQEKCLHTSFHKRDVLK